MSTPPDSSHLPTPPDSSPPPAFKQRRGFAILKETDPSRLSAIAAKGGVGAHKAGTAHEFTSDEARIAGQKGGRAAHRVLRARKALLTETGQQSLATPDHEKI
jgi:general stress protein YciG